MAPQLSQMFKSQVVLRGWKLDLIMVCEAWPLGRGWVGLSYDGDYKENAHGELLLCAPLLLGLPVDLFSTILHVLPHSCLIRPRASGTAQS